MLSKHSTFAIVAVLFFSHAAVIFGNEQEVAIEQAVACVVALNKKIVDGVEVDAQEDATEDEVAEENAEVVAVE